MKICRILDRAKFEVPHNTHIHLTEFGKGIDYNGKALQPREIKQFNNKTLINGHEVHNVSLELKKGYLHNLENVYNVKSVPKPLELRTLSDIENLPSYHYGQNERFTNNLSDSIKEKSPKGSLDHLGKDSDITMKDLEKSPALKNTCEFLQGRSVRTFSGILLTFGGLASVLLILNEHRKELHACLAYTYDKGAVQVCKIATCTCINGEINTFDNKYKLCSPNFMDLLPDDMKNPKNCDGNKGLNCKNCPSQTFRDKYGSDAINKDDLNEYSQLDKVYIECRSPSIWDALGDITHGVSEAVLDVVKNASSAVGWFIKNLPTILGVGALVFGVLILVWFVRFLGFGNNKSNIYDFKENSNSKYRQISIGDEDD